MQIQKTKKAERYTLLATERQSVLAQYAHDIRQGLSAPVKSIPSHYVYDDVGALLFEQISQASSYYLRRIEEDILAENAAQIAQQMPAEVALVELGSGNSVKTRHLIEALLHKQGTLQYVPLDVSHAMLDKTSQALCQDYPALQVLGVAATYQEGLPLIAQELEMPKLIIWLGSDIGQMNRSQAAQFLTQVKTAMGEQGGILISMDVKKAANVIESAYVSQDQVEALRQRFARNMLARINRDLGGHFDLETFGRKSFYNEAEGRIEVSLVSLKEQQVPIDALGLTVHFAEHEVIRLHTSYKYSIEDIHALAQAAGLQLKAQWLDEQQWFSVNLFCAATKE